MAVAVVVVVAELVHKMSSLVDVYAGALQPDSDDDVRRAGGDARHERHDGRRECALLV